MFDLWIGAALDLTATSVVVNAVFAVIAALGAVVTGQPARTGFLLSGAVATAAAVAAGVVHVLLSLLA